MTETPLRSLLVLVAVALVCSILVSVAAITLRPIQEQNALIERYRHIVALTGLTAEGEEPGDAEILEVVRRLDVRVVNLETGEFVPEIRPDDVDARSAATDPELSTAIPSDVDTAQLGRRANHHVIYLVWGDAGLSRVILPIHGQGMWSTLFGFLALEADLNTIAAVSFYEQAETAGLGDQLQSPAWQSLWAGRRLFGSRGELRFRVAGGAVDPDSPAAGHEVDGMSGATVTGKAVTNLVRFWFDAHGYGPFLAHLSQQPPERSASTTLGSTRPASHATHGAGD